MDKDRSWLGALAGIVFLVLAIVSFAVGGEPPDIDKPAQEIVDFYVDKKDMAFLGAILEGIAATLFIFFAGYLRSVLRDVEGGRGFLSAVMFAGAIIFATGLAIDATLTFALAETAEDIDPTAVQAVAAIWHNDFVPFAVGVQIFTLALGLLLLRGGVVPKWLGWVAIVLALIAVTPIGFAAFIGTAILIGVLSVLLTMRARKGSSAA